MVEFPGDELEVIVRMTEDACAREPIHTPGAIQGHGVLLLLSSDGDALVSRSANAGRFCPSLRPDCPREWLPPELRAVLAALAEDGDVTLPAPLPDGIGWRHVHCFRRGAVCGVEFEADEPPPDPASLQRLTLLVGDEVRAFQDVADPTELGQRLVERIRRETGFDRVLLYTFDDDGNGDVVAESQDGGWPQSLLGLRFPASDIPSQARALYGRVRQRWTPARDYVEVPLDPPLDPRDGRPFDISLSCFRAVSPAHTLYQRNLGVDGAMALSVLLRGRLWGLVVGHARRPHRVAPPVRHAVGLMVDAFSLRLAALVMVGEAESFAARMNGLTAHLGKLAGEDDFVDALLRPPLTVGDMFDGCGGVAIVHRDAARRPVVRLSGATPPDGAVLGLVEWLRVSTTDMVVAMDCVSALYPAFSRHAGVASGLLAAFLGDERDQAILWFRPEEVREIAWGGRPEKIHDAASGTYLPRRSFDRWVEKRTGHARRWLGAEIHAARVFATAVSKLIIRQRQRISALSAERERFLWVTSHHLRESPRRIAIDCDLLRHRMPPDAHAAIADILDQIRDTALGMDSRLRGLIAYSELGASSVPPVATPLADCLAQARDTLAAEIAASGASIRVLGTLPVVLGERRGLVFVIENLLENALVFRTPGTAPDIRLWAEAAEGGWQLSLADNGVGIEAPYLERVFDLFETLNAGGEAPGGIGMGLTLSRRIVERLGGRIWLESKVGHGTIAHLLLPAAPDAGSVRNDGGTMALLRAATHDLHEAASRSPHLSALAEGRVTAAQYRDALALLYGFYCPVEQVLFSRHATLAASCAVVPKTPALIADLMALGLTREQVAALPLAVPPAVPEDDAAALGAFYVLEGATLGGQVVLRRIAHCLGPLMGVATSFHGFHGADTGAHWRRFQARLCQCGDASPVARQALVDAAVVTFAALGDWLHRP